MHFRITKENFLTAINTAIRAVPSRSPLPVTTALLLRAVNGQVEITGSDLELMIRCSTPAREVYREGEAVIPARQLAEIVRRITDTEMELEAAGPNAILTYEGGEVQLAAFLPDEFPLLGSEATAEEVLELGTDFRDALRAVLYAAGKDELRPIFTGVQVQIVDGTLTLAATDGHRLAVYEMMAAEAQSAVASVIPAKALREVERVLSQTGGGLTVSIGANQACFRVDSIEVVTRLIEGRFPEWRGAVPQGPPITVIKGSLSQLVSALERAQVLAAGETPTVIIKVTAGTVTVEAQSEYGGMRETLPLEATGDDLEIAFNAGYLLEALRATTGSAVEIAFSGKIGPALVRVSEAPGYLGLVLPLRLV